MNQKLHWLEAMRGVAACWVLLHHAGQSVGHFFGFEEIQLLANGYLGVDFFFVLSGFIIASSGNRLLESGRGFSEYAQARLIRIYVPYLPIGIAMVALYALLPDLSASDRSPGLVTSLTLLPSASPPALSVAWTLVHELIFYVLFSIIFISRSLLWVVLSIWAAGIGWHIIAGSPLDGAWRYFLSPLNLCFLLGVATYYLTRRSSSGWMVAGAAAGVLALALEAGALEPNRIILSLGFAGLIVASCAPLAQRNSPGAAALLLGAASYSIYLVDDPVISIASRLLQRAGLAGNTSAALAAVSGIALTAGLLYYLVYERKALAWARKLVMPQRVVSPSSLPGPGIGAVSAAQRPPSTESA